LGKWRRADVSRHAGGDLARALRRIIARTAVTAFSHDHVFPAADCQAEQQLIPGSTFAVIESPWGHYAWGMTPAETAAIDRALAPRRPRTGSPPSRGRGWHRPRPSGTPVGWRNRGPPLNARPPAGGRAPRSPGWGRTNSPPRACRR